MYFKAIIQLKDHVFNAWGESALLDTGDIWCMFWEASNIPSKPTV